MRSPHDSCACHFECLQAWGMSRQIRIEILWKSQCFTSMYDPWASSYGKTKQGALARHGNATRVGSTGHCNALWLDRARQGVVGSTWQDSALWFDTTMQSAVARQSKATRCRSARQCKVRWLDWALHCVLGSAGQCNARWFDMARQRALVRHGNAKRCGSTEQGNAL